MACYFTCSHLSLNSRSFFFCVAVIVRKSKLLFDSAGRKTFLYNPILQITWLKTREGFLTSSSLVPKAWFLHFYFFKSWKSHPAIRIEDCFLTCIDNVNCRRYSWLSKGYGARHCIPFSPMFPHFEVSSFFLSSVPTPSEQLDIVQYIVFTVDFCQRTSV